MFHYWHRCHLRKRRTHQWSAWESALELAWESALELDSELGLGLELELGLGLELGSESDSEWATELTRRRSATTISCRPIPSYPTLES